LFVEVIIPLALPKNYTWQVPEQMQLAIAPGIRVEVALRKNKKYAGIVKRIVKEIPAQFTPSPILNILDSTPVVN
jgi:primosomal protein N' (replication factor Y)